MTNENEVKATFGAAVKSVGKKVGDAGSFSTKLGFAVAAATFGLQLGLIAVGVIIGIGQGATDATKELITGKDDTADKTE